MPFAELGGKLPPPLTLRPPAPAPPSLAEWHGQGARGATSGARAGDELEANREETLTAGCRIHEPGEQIHCEVRLKSLYSLSEDSVCVI